MAETLTGYRLMWMLVMFDLPVGTRTERRTATGFRKFLLDQGFDMCQFSVYLRFCGGKEQVETYTKKIVRALPRVGSVQVLTFTDRQYEKIISFDSGSRLPRNKNPDQFTLF